MKAIIITSPGAPSVLKIEDRETPEPGAEEVLIKVKAAGVNRPDVFQRKGNYPAPPGVAQDIPGLEVSGTIAKCGAGVKRWQEGDQVCALVAGEGYAEYVKVLESHCLPVPKNLDLIAAAGLPETVFTVWSNVFQRGRLKGGENLLIHGGSSGIGITGIQLAKAFGARVFVTVSTEEKGQACLVLGADQFINYKTQDFEKELAATGMDVILDMIGGNYFDKNLNILNAEGRLVYINAMQGNVVNLNVMKMMQKRITITGSTLRGREAKFKTALTNEIEQQVWPLLEAGKFKPVVFKTFSFSEAAKAHELMESSQHIGKIILVNE
jgi:NADPH2:quinone reductase